MSKPTIFRDYLKILSVINEEPVLEFTPDGLNVVSMDPSHVTMIDFSLPREYFDKYTVDETTRIVLKLPDVLSVLKKLDKLDEQMSFIYEYDVQIKEIASTQEKEEIETTKIKVNERVKLVLKSDINREKTLLTLEPLEEEIPKPKIYFKSKTRMLLSTFKRIIDDFKDSNHLTIKTDWDSITFSINNDVANEVTSIDKSNCNILNHQVEEKSKAIYQIEHFPKMVTAISKVSEVVNLSISDDMPILIDVELPQGSLQWFMAPCIGV